MRGAPSTGAGRAVLAAALVCALILPVGGSAAAAPIGCTVTDLKDAINAANASPDVTTIELATGCTYTLTAADHDISLFWPRLHIGLPAIKTPVTVTGNAATLERSSPSGAHFGLIEVADGGSLTLNGPLTMRNGQSNQGGAVLTWGGPVHADGVTFSGNQASIGGAISAQYPGAYSIRNSTFKDNSAAFGGAISASVATSQIATVVVTNSTFTQNSASDSGGAVTAPGGASMEVSHSTFSGNSSPDGADVGHGIVSTRNSVLANPASGTSCISGEAPSDGGGNIAWPVLHNCGGGFTTADPNLGTLGDNGGPTETMLPGTGSAAIDHVPSTGANCLPVDQRGLLRPAGPACDAGSVEVDGAANPSGKTSAAATGSLSVGAAPLPAPSIAPGARGLVVGRRCVPPLGRLGRRSLGASFTLDRAATVTYSLERRTNAAARRKCPARQVGGRFVRLRRFVRTIGTAARVSASLRLLGPRTAFRRPDGSRLADLKLAPGTYRLTVTATNANGTSSTLSRDFIVLKP